MTTPFRTRRPTREPAPAWIALAALLALYTAITLGALTTVEFIHPLLTLLTGTTTGA